MEERNKVNINTHVYQWA